MAVSTANWSDKWRVAINMTKTVALLTDQQRIMPPKLKLPGQEVECQTRVQHLGVQIDHSMRMVTQRKRIRAQQNIALRMIVRVRGYVINDGTARDLRIEAVEEFI
ncbi:hypothetical protein EVAR_20609_1 [Eumeta japonica]|uniref:Uncharacterized protein n=1 Tax=Eumeta variegata TaxID=151549 RepID=A0A4C1UTC6_EUMVA|nr:hypothetical protein EVAR_20609_1 [Eumeta japonica]